MPESDRDPACRRLSQAIRPSDVCDLAAIVALDHEAAVADVAAATGEVGLDVEDAQHLD
jgi:hypothetical protein